MKKYYFNDGTAQQGPFTFEELQAKNITAETPVWYDGLPDWTTAGQLEELKGVLVHTPPPFHAKSVTPVAAATVAEEAVPVATATVAEEAVPVATATVAEEAVPVATATVAEEAVPVVTATVAEEAVPVTTTKVAATAVPTATKVKAPVKSAKKSTAWLSYVLGLLVLGGVGYLVYDDMEKNKGKTNVVTTMPATTDSLGNTTQPTTVQPTSTMVSADDTATTTTEPGTTTPATITTATPTTTPPATVTTTKTTGKPVPAKPTAAEIKAKQLEAQKLAQKLAQKKAEEEKKKLLAAEAALAAAAAKERDYRNNWPRYITFGKLDYKDDGDKIAAFDVPVYNGTNAMIDKVTVRVDYMKKDKKVLKSETIFIYNIPAGAGINGKAPESKKGNNVKVFITGITSRKLHFCFPANNGNPADPYFCN